MDILIPDLGGGRNRGLPPEKIAANECVEVLNFYPIGTKLRRRGGCTLKTQVGPRALSSCHHFSKQGILDGSRGSGPYNLVLIGTVLGLASTRLSGGVAITDATPVGGLVAAASSGPWCCAIYKDIAYLIAPGWGKLLRANVAAGVVSYQEAGIAAPVGVPTMADGGAGVLPAGNYYGVYTYYNSYTGVESNPSPPSLVLALGASRLINWGNVTVSTNPQVNQRRLYRTIANQTNEYYYVGTINDNVTTVLAGENVSIAAMDRSVSFDNGRLTTPTYGFFHLALWRDRLFVTDGLYVYYSELGLAECFNVAENILKVNTSDGQLVTGLCAWDERLVIAKANQMMLLSGYGPSSFSLSTLTDKHGCLDRDSLATAEGTLFWWGGDNFYASTGASVSAIGDVQIRDICNRGLNWARACINPDHSQYVVNVQCTDNNDRLQLVFNYKRGTWVVYQSNFNSLTPKYPVHIAQYNESPYGLMTVGDDWYLYTYDDPAINTDGDGGANPQSIEAAIVTRALRHPDGGTIVLRRVHVECEQLAEVLEAYAYVDAANATIFPGLGVANRRISDGNAVSLNYPENWKSFSLHSALAPSGRIADQVLVALRYTGTLPITIGALGFDVDKHERRVRRAQ